MCNTNKDIKPLRRENASEYQGERNMARLFGTDGVRGEANVTLLPEMAYRLGRAATIYTDAELKAPYQTALNALWASKNVVVSNYTAAKTVMAMAITRMVRFFCSMGSSPLGHAACCSDGKLLRGLRPQALLPQDGVCDPAAGLTVPVWVHRMGHLGVSCLVADQPLSHGDVVR